MVDSVSNDDLGHLLGSLDTYYGRIIKHAGLSVQGIHFITFPEPEPPLITFSFGLKFGNHIAIYFNKQGGLQNVVQKPDLELDYFASLAICSQCLYFCPRPSLKVALSLNFQGVEIISGIKILPPDSFIFTHKSYIACGGLLWLRKLLNKVNSLKMVLVKGF